MIRKLFLIPFLLLFALFSYGQSVQLVYEQAGISFRGLSVINNKVAWVSGTKGTIGKTTDGGKTWEWLKVAGYETTDFRDIEAFDKNTAVIMGIASPGVILKTTDGGKNWKKVYENSHSAIFMDAMHFWNEMSGIVIGDPIDGRFFILRSFNGGETWMELEAADGPVAIEGEACFAASGTNITALDKDEAVFVTGGSSSRVFIRENAIELPLQTGPSAGANSIAVYDNRKLKGGNNLYVVGGDFSNDTLRAGNAAFSTDRGTTWQQPATPPHGYRSSVEYINQSTLISCGTSGVDYSTDGGNHWRNISTTGYHVVKKAKKGKLVLLAGGNGKIGVLTIR